MKRSTNNTKKIKNESVQDQVSVLKTQFLELLAPYQIDKVLLSQIETKFESVIRPLFGSDSQTNTAKTRRKRVNNSPTNDDNLTTWRKCFNSTKYGYITSFPEETAIIKEEMKNSGVKSNNFKLANRLLEYLRQENLQKLKDWSARILEIKPNMPGKTLYSFPDNSSPVSPKTETNPIQSKDLAPIPVPVNTGDLLSVEDETNPNMDYFLSTTVEVFKPIPKGNKSDKLSGKKSVGKPSDKKSVGKPSSKKSVGKPSVGKQVVNSVKNEVTDGSEADDSDNDSGNDI